MYTFMPSVTGVAHAGTSISAGLGMATAFEAQGSDARVVCVIGDGGLTCGMAFEALNQAGHLRKNLIVILNDNEWSISKNVGALSTYLTRLTSAPLYRRFEEDVWELLGKIPKAGGKAQDLAHRMKESLKNLVIPGVMFEELGFKYYGPIDGHDLAEVVHTLEHLKHQRGPVLVHAVTEKGKGYPFAPTSKTRAHGVSPAADPKKAKSRRSYTEIFGEALIAVLWACEGYYFLTYAGGEVRDPARTLPRALTFGLLSIGVIYLVANTVYLYALPMAELSGTTRVAEKAATAR